MEISGRLGEVFRLERETSLGADGGDGHNLDLLAGLAGQMHIHLVVGDGFEVELIDVEVAGGGRVFHGEGDGDELNCDTVGAEVFALVVRVEGAGHVLGVFDVLRAGWLERAGHGEEQVAGAGFSDGGGG